MTSASATMKQRVTICNWHVVDESRHGRLTELADPTMGRASRAHSYAYLQGGRIGRSLTPLTGLIAGEIRVYSPCPAAFEPGN